MLVQRADNSTDTSVGLQQVDGLLRALLRFMCFGPYEQHFQAITSIHTSVYDFQASTQSPIERDYQDSQISYANQHPPSSRIYLTALSR